MKIFMFVHINHPRIDTISSNTCIRPLKLKLEGLLWQRNPQRSVLHLVLFEPKNDNEKLLVGISWNSLKVPAKAFANRNMEH
jgi:hypothetical protein